MSSVIFRQTISTAKYVAQCASGNAAVLSRPLVACLTSNRPFSFQSIFPALPPRVDTPFSSVEPHRGLKFSSLFRNDSTLQVDDATERAQLASNCEIKVPKFAIVHVGGKQYKVTETDTITINRLPAKHGSAIILNKVLLVGSKDWTAIGTPLLEHEGVKVTAVVEEHLRGAKIQVFKKKRRKGYARRKGFRPELTTLRIVAIECPAPSAK